MFKTNKKNRIALLFAVSMLSGVSLSAVGSIKANAADTTAPSVTAYASKDDLENEFAPDSGNIGKLKFGKKYNSLVSHYEDMEWYILGSDSEVSKVSGDNTVIFATSNMIPSGYQVFNSDSSNEKDYTDSMGTYTTKPQKVLPNHYGASDIRKALNEISEGTSTTYKNLLSDVEIGMLNATTVRTDDFRGGSKTDYRDTPNYYTTSDKLYLPSWDYRGQKTNYPTWNTTDFEYVYIGSESDRKTPSDAQWNSSEQDWFWLRSPRSNISYSSLYAYPGDGVDFDDFVFDDYGVRPASNLNLSNVLFASAATPTSNEDYKANIIADDTAMTLRLKGSSSEIGSATVSKNTIKVTRGSTTEPVYLVIQGKNPTTEVDWYWSKKISDTTDIISGVEYWTIPLSVIDGFETSWNLSDCKIWLESPLDSDADTISYAIEATESTEPEECKHEHLEFVPETKPTKTEPGYKEHWICKVCGKLFVYIAGMRTEVTKEDLIIPDTDKKTSSSSSSSSHINTGWIKDGKGWKYRNSDGIHAQGTTVTDADGNKVEKVLWQKAGNGYYAFGSDGYLITGWIYDRLEDKWYYCDENMGKLYGWFNESQDGYWYYLSPSTGEALTGWHTINGKDYYFAGTPSAPTYSFDASTDTWIYSNLNGVRPFGSMYANTITPDNYQVDANGAWIR